MAKFGLEYANVCLNEPRICVRYTKNMLKICRLNEAVKIIGLFNIKQSVPFTDPMVTNVCDIGLGIEGSTSVANGFFCTFCTFLRPPNSTGLKYAKVCQKEPRICVLYTKNMSKICRLNEAVKIIGLFNIKQSVPFTDPMVTNVCDIGLGIEGSTSVANAFFLHLLSLLKAPQGSKSIINTPFKVLT